MNQNQPHAEELGEQEALEPNTRPGPMALSGVSLIAAERQRQITEEGWSAAHDDAHEQEKQWRLELWGEFQAVVYFPDGTASDIMARCEAENFVTRHAASIERLSAPAKTEEHWTYGKHNNAQQEFVITTESGEFVGTKESESDAARFCEIHNRPASAPPVEEVGAENRKCLCMDEGPPFEGCPIHGVLGKPEAGADDVKAVLQKAREIVALFYRKDNIWLRTCADASSVLTKEIQEILSQP